MPGSKWCRVAFGLRIRMLRKLRGWTQGAAAQHCGMDSKSYGAIERGERNITLNQVARVGTGFSVELHELFMFSSKSLSDRDNAAKKQIFEAIRVAPAQHKLLMLGILNEVINFQHWDRLGDGPPVVGRLARAFPPKPDGDVEKKNRKRKTENGKRRTRS
ncbi:MAG: helix-turn-helix transcriptional regulator [Planctomycetes bacterium]|nr:helix-turn-helix transcriptional regulator [Planctomycetota bacterium]